MTCFGYNIEKNQYIKFKQMTVHPKLVIQLGRFEILFLFPPGEPTLKYFKWGSFPNFIIRNRFIYIKYQQYSICSLLSQAYIGKFSFLKYTLDFIFSARNQYYIYFQSFPIQTYFNSNLPFYYRRRMSKIDQIRDTYIKDADLMSSKSRFGYFSILPNHSAAINTYQQKKIIKGQNGKVQTQQRNIFSGLTATGVLKKSYFNYEGSVFQGDPYIDPGKNERKEKMLEEKKLVDKEIYKPLSLAKTPEPKAAYEHVAEKPIKKLVKDYVDSNGKVRTEQRNVVSNPSSNIEKQRLKQFKYMPDPYQYYRIVQKNELRKSITQRGENPFKLSSQQRGQFSSYRQTYGLEEKYKINIEDRGEKKQKQKLNISVEHEGNFKPSCSKKYDTFSYPEYVPGGQKQTKKIKEQSNKQKQSFKLFAPHKNSKPCPSISGLKTNILRCIR